MWDAIHNPLNTQLLKGVDSVDSVDSIDSTNHLDSLYHSYLPLYNRLLTDHPHWQPFDLRATLYPQAPSHQLPIATYFD